MEHHGVDMLLGLDILEEWQASICFKHKTLTLRSSHPDSSSKRQLQQNYIIPFGVEHSNIQPNQQHRLYDQLTNNNDDYSKRHHHLSMNIPTTNDQSELLPSQHQDHEPNIHDPYDDNDYDSDYHNLNRKERNPRNRIFKRPSTSFTTAKNVKEIFSSPKNNLPSTNILPRNKNDNKYNMHQKSFPDIYTINLSASYNDNGEDSAVTAKSTVECHHELSTRNKQQHGMDAILITTTSSTSQLKDYMDSITDNFYDDDDTNDEYVLSSDDDYDGFDLSGI